MCAFSQVASVGIERFRGNRKGKIPCAIQLERGAKRKEFSYNSRVSALNSATQLQRARPGHSLGRRRNLGKHFFASRNGCAALVALAGCCNRRNANMQEMHFALAGSSRGHQQECAFGCSVANLFYVLIIILYVNMSSMLLGPAVCARPFVGCLWMLSLLCSFPYAGVDWC